MGAVQHLLCQGAIGRMMLVRFNPLVGIQCEIEEAYDK
ncbi:hypothetical protein SBA2_330005 [Acidobacteriia bacterium SbA2]|nr:hypothetical protein SBA2_330005 [Acidobacteriia bacterium SbA2]